MSACYNFEVLMSNIINKCEGNCIEDFRTQFQYLYPFTTENIGGYINAFDLMNKTLLTVGSSGDQIINALLYGCTDITSLDINPNGKFYIYLKLACILELERYELLHFLSFKDCPQDNKENMDVFNIETYNKIKKTLRLLDYESYLIWDELFQSFPAAIIRDKLFCTEQSMSHVIIGCNPYLADDISYQEVREKLKKLYLHFICGDLFQVNIDKKFDNIWLSNIGTYLSINRVKLMVDKMNCLLREDGRLLISYLYQTTMNSTFPFGNYNIYDLKSTFASLQEYSPYLISFLSVDSMKYKDTKTKDSALIYHKSFF